MSDVRNEAVRKMFYNIIPDLRNCVKDIIRVRGNKYERLEEEHTKTSARFSLRKCGIYVELKFLTDKNNDSYVSLCVGSNVTINVGYFIVVHTHHDYFNVQPYNYGSYFWLTSDFDNFVEIVRNHYKQYKYENVTATEIEKNNSKTEQLTSNNSNNNTGFVYLVQRCDNENGIFYPVGVYSNYQDAFNFATMELLDYYSEDYEDVRERKATLIKYRLPWNDYDTRYTITEMKVIENGIGDVKNE